MAKIKRDRTFGNGTQNKSRKPKYRCINKYGLICKNYNKCRYFPQLKPTCIQFILSQVCPEVTWKVHRTFGFRYKIFILVDLAVFIYFILYHCMCSDNNRASAKILCNIYNNYFVRFSEIFVQLLSNTPDEDIKFYLHNISDFRATKSLVINILFNRLPKNNELKLYQFVWRCLKENYVILF